MTTPILYFSNNCCGECHPACDDSCNRGDKVYVGSLVFDTIVSLGCLIAGILGACSVIGGLGTIASYSLIGVSGVITLAWIAMIISKSRSKASRSYQAI